MNTERLLQIVQLRREASRIRRQALERGSVSASVQRILGGLESKLAEMSAQTQQDTLGGLAGFEDGMVIGGGGTACPVVETIRYRLVELDRLIPSHMPLDDFKPDPRYPARVQERRYDVDRREQLKVLGNAEPNCFVPTLIVNTEPTGLNGNPVALPDGLVLSGNGRTMTLQVIYARHPKAADAYKDTLRQRAALFGFAPEDVDRLRQPVLVRVMAQAGRSRQELAELVRRFNEDLTQAMDPVTASIAHGRRVSERIIARLHAMEDDETFLQFVRRDRVFIRLVQEDGLLPKERIGAFIERDRLTGADRLTKEGAEFIQRALLGKAVPDPASIEMLHLNLRDALTRAVPFILQASEGNVSNPAAWNPIPALPHAIRLWASATASGKRRMRDFVDQLALFPPPKGVLLNEATAAIATALLMKPGTRQQPSGWRAFAEKVAASNTFNLFGDEPVASFAGAFGIERGDYTGTGIVPAKDFRLPQGVS